MRSHVRFRVPQSRYEKSGFRDDLVLRKPPVTRQFKHRLTELLLLRRQPYAEELVVDRVPVIPTTKHLAVHQPLKGNRHARGCAQIMPREPRQKLLAPVLDGGKLRLGLLDCRKALLSILQNLPPTDKLELLPRDDLLGPIVVRGPSATRLETLQAHAIRFDCLCLFCHLVFYSLSAAVLMKSAMSAAKATRTPMKPWDVEYPSAPAPRRSRPTRTRMRRLARAAPRDRTARRRA